MLFIFHVKWFLTKYPFGTGYCCLLFLGTSVLSFTHRFLSVWFGFSASPLQWLFCWISISVPPFRHRTMWFPRLTLLLLLRFSGVLPVEGYNTCQSINLDAQKSRRIEAVRGQILSKLRIRSPPDDDDDKPAPPPVPPEVMLLYNSTRELLKDRARLAETTCERESSEEDYYAKEVQRIDMLPPRTATSKSWVLGPKS